MNPENPPTPIERSPEQPSPEQLKTVRVEDLPWSKLTVDQRVERIRGIIHNGAKNGDRQNQRVTSLERQFRSHHHLGGSGDVCVPVNEERTVGYACSDEPTNGDPWF